MYKFQNDGKKTYEVMKEDIFGDDKLTIRFIGLVVTGHYQEAYDLCVEFGGCCDKEQFEEFIDTYFNSSLLDEIKTVNYHTPC